jgi:hypothetical protein
MAPGLGISFVAGSEESKNFAGNLKDQALIWFIQMDRPECSYPWHKAGAFVGYEEQCDGYDGEVQEELKPTQFASQSYWSAG